MTSKKPLIVNGPVNVFRLNGKIGSVDKTLYIFVYQRSDTRNECDNIYSIDIESYLYRCMNKNKSPLDIFVHALFRLTPNNDGTNFLKYHLHRTNDMFSKIINPDKNIDRHGEKMSTVLPNVRVHSVLIGDFFRDIVQIHNIAKKNLKHMFVKLFNGDVYILPISLDYTKEILRQYTVLVDNVLSAFGSEECNETAMNIRNTIHNMRTKIKDYDVRTMTNNLLDTAHKRIHHISEKLGQLINEFNTFVEKNNISFQRDPKSIKVQLDLYDGHRYLYSDNIKNESLLTYIEKLLSLFEEIESMFKSAYGIIYVAMTLRRFLDKEYITRGLINDEMSFFTEYMLVILMSTFKFNLTNVAYATVNLSDLVKEITKCKTIFEIDEDNGQDFRKYLYRPTFSLCSDMTNFPDYLS